MQIAVMTPLPVQFDNFTEYILKQSWSSLYKQFNLTDDSVHIYFSAIPKLYNEYSAHLAANFKLPYTVLEVKYVNSMGLEGKDARLPELAHHRNLLLNEGKKHDYALFLDSDVILPSGAINRLIQGKKDVTGGILPQARIAAPIKIQDEKIQNIEDFTAFLALGIFDETFRSVTWGDIQKAELSDVVATACMLLNRKIMNDAQVEFRLFLLDDPGGGFLGEDVGYCLSALCAGYKVSVNPAVLCGHMRRIQERLAAYLRVTDSSVCSVNFLFWPYQL